MEHEKSKHEEQSEKYVEAHHKAFTEKRKGLAKKANYGGPYEVNKSIRRQHDKNKKKSGIIKKVLMRAMDKDAAKGKSFLD
jgi:hypothetical protein